MTDPRWTVDEDDNLWWGLSDETSGRLFGDALRWDEDRAYDALVAAVRDADTLRQARQLAAQAVDMTLTDDERFGRHQFLLRLLAPPAPDTEDTTT